MLRFYRRNCVASKGHANRRIGDIRERHELPSKLFEVALLIMIAIGRSLPSFLAEGYEQDDMSRRGRRSSPRQGRSTCPVPLGT
jgi:hypothetical protein